MLRSSKILYVFESRIENKNKWTRRGVWEKEIRDDAQLLILSNWKNGEIEKNVQSRRSILLEVTSILFELGCR